MKLLVLLGSARKKGNTATILKWIEGQVVSMGHDVETIALASHEINGCLGCAKCKEVPDKIGCVRNDDALMILDAVIKADVVLFASPIYFWGFNAQMKAIIDRMYALVTNYHQPGHASLVEGSRHALLVTGGGPYENNAEPVFTAFERIRGFLKTENAGELYIGGCTVPEKIDLSAKDKAISFARGLVG